MIWHNNNWHLVHTTPHTYLLHTLLHTICCHPMSPHVTPCRTPHTTLTIHHTQHTIVHVMLPKAPALMADHNMPQATHNTSCCRQHTKHIISHYVVDSTTQSHSCPCHDVVSNTCKQHTTSCCVHHTTHNCPHHVAKSTRTQKITPCCNQHIANHIILSGMQQFSSHHIIVSTTHAIHRDYESAL